MVLSVLHQAGWADGSGQNVDLRETTLSGHHLSLILDHRSIKFYGAHLTAPNAIPYSLMCDQDLRIPAKIARKAWEWALGELPAFRSCSILGGVSGPELAFLKWQGFLVETSLTYYKPLTAGMDILEGFGPKRRNIVRRESSRLRVNHNAPIDEFLINLDQTYQRKGVRSGNFEVLANRMQWAVSEKIGAVTSAYTKDGTFAAGIFCLWDETLCHYLFGCTNVDLPTPEGSSLCLYEIMSQRQGMTKYFNFEGSILRGVESFVRSFEPEPILLAGGRQTLWTRNAKYVPFLRRFIV